MEKNIKAKAPSNTQGIARGGSQTTLIARYHFFRIISKKPVLN